MTDNSHRTEAGPSQRSVEIGTAVGLIVFSAVVIYGSLQVGIDWGAEGPKAGFFPFYVALMIILASLVNLVRIFLDDVRGLYAEWGQLGQVLAVIIPTTVYVFTIPWLGFYLTSMLLIGVFMRRHGRYPWWMVASVSVGVTVMIYLMFEKWFLVPLPKGPAEDFLGL